MYDFCINTFYSKVLKPFKELIAIKKNKQQIKNPQIKYLYNSIVFFENTYKYNIELNMCIADIKHWIKYSDHTKQISHKEEKKREKSNSSEMGVE